MKLADLVESNYELLVVLARMGIPLGFGEASVGEVCRQRGISAELFLMIQEFIRGSTMKGDNTDNDTVLKYDYLGDALIAFRNITALKLNINITQLAIILQATKIASVQDRDYRPPVIKSDGVPRKFNENMRYRSVVTAYAFQNHRRTIFDPLSYLISKRPPHYLDWLMRELPNEDS
jgi:hypothetical protein